MLVIWLNSKIKVGMILLNWLMLPDFSGRWQYRIHCCRFLGSARIQNKGMIVGKSQFPIMGG